MSLTRFVDEIGNRQGHGNGTRKFHRENGRHRNPTDPKNVKKKNEECIYIYIARESVAPKKF